MQTITLFTIPQAFEDEYEIQWNAIKSWTLLNPKPDIFLLGNMLGVASIANELGLYHIPNIEQNASISEIAKWLDRLINNTTLVYINPSMILTESFTQTIQEIYNNQDHFFLTGQYKTIQTKDFIDFNDNHWQHQLRVMADKQDIPQRQLQNSYLVFTKQLLKQLFMSEPNIESSWEKQLLSTALKKCYPIIDSSSIITPFLQISKYTTLRKEQKLLNATKSSIEVRRNIEDFFDNNQTNLVQIKRNFFQNRINNDTLEDVTIIIKTFLRPNALANLLQSIKKYYPNIKIYVADDSDKPRIRKDVDEYFVLPFDSGISYGRNYLIDRVKTKYVMLLDDDTIFTENTKIEWALEVFNQSNKIDLVSGYYLPEIFYGSLTKDNNNLVRNMRLARTIIDGFPIFDFVPNFFVAKTEKLKNIKWNEKLKILEHTEFFWRAKGKINCTYLPYFISINSHIKTKGLYLKYREDRINHFLKIKAKEIGVSAVVSKNNKPNFTKNDVCSIVYEQPK